MPAFMNDNYLVYIFFVACGGLGSLRFMHKNHPSEVYAIWLVFSFFFVIFLAIAAIAERHGVELAHVCGSYEETCRSAYAMLTNFEDEIYLVVAFTGATIAPQVLAYLLSGITGSAVAPQYLRIIQQAAAWSFIKFVAGLSGILLAQPLAKVLVGKPHPPLADYVPAVAFISMAFFYAWMILGFWDWWDAYFKKNFHGEGLKQRHIRMLLRFHRLCTRNVPKPSPLSYDRRLLIQLLKSDSVYDYVTRQKMPPNEDASLHLLAELERSIHVATRGNRVGILPAPADDSSTTSPH
jgi:hypothetical protein